MVVPARMHQLE